MDFFEGFFSNLTLWVAVLAWAVAQTIKVIIGIVKNRRLTLSLFISSGAMPSSHSAFVCALSAGVGIIEGFSSPIFALAAVISLVVMYDAAGVRRAAGKQAEAINMIVEKFEDQGLKMDKELKELLGHTPVEVLAGAVLGAAVAVLIIR